MLLSLKMLIPLFGKSSPTMPKILTEENKLAAIEKYVAEPPIIDRTLLFSVAILSRATDPTVIIEDMEVLTKGSFKMF